MPFARRGVVAKMPRSLDPPGEPEAPKDRSRHQLRLFGPSAPPEGNAVAGAKGTNLHLALTRLHERLCHRPRRHARPHDRPRVRPRRGSAAGVHVRNRRPVRRPRRLRLGPRQRRLGLRGLHRPLLVPLLVRSGGPGAPDSPTRRGCPYVPLRWFLFFANILCVLVSCRQGAKTPRSVDLGGLATSAGRAYSSMPCRSTTRTPAGGITVCTSSTFTSKMRESRFARSFVVVSPGSSTT